MTVARYSIGSPNRPDIRHDNGHLDQFARRAPLLGDKALRLGWQGVLEATEAIQRIPFLPHNDVPDALAAYRHFLDGSGETRTINYERYLSNDPSGQTTLRNIMFEATEATYTLWQSLASSARAGFSFTGTAIAVGSGNTAFPYPATANWQKALGGHSLWLSGDVTTKTDPRGPVFDVMLTIHVEDMYNFNPGAADIASGIPDGANGAFELTGLARQYLNVATVQRRLMWTGNPGTNPPLVSGESSRRQRQPGDNRRVRNRL